ncbi:hypothetical protein ACIRJL_17190 [Streptomyces sp. NPDC102383]|uniref:hypothetical protein n=1 Tax=Streptomyces sp. NPDC102383 TaxID=3366165 RepID=UPI0037F224D8
MPLDLTTAQQELDEARALLATLQEQVRDGDDTVTAQQLADQKELIALAELRVTAAERAEKQAAADDLAARATAVGQQVRDLVSEDSTASLVSAVQAVMTAVDTLVSAASARQAAIVEVATAAETMNAELGGSRDDPWPSAAYGFRGSASNYPAGVTALGQGRAFATPVGELLGVALSAALVGRREDRRRAAEMMAGIQTTVQGKAAGVPGLSSALRLTSQQWAALGTVARYESTEQGRRPDQGM